MRKFLQNFIIIIAIVFVISCQVFIEPMPKSWNWKSTPRPLTGMRNFPSADTDYGQGFKDGCGAAWDGVAKGILGDVNHEAVDGTRLGTNLDYGAGWNDGLEQCTYILDWDVL